MQWSEDKVTKYSINMKWLTATLTSISKFTQIFCSSYDFLYFLEFTKLLNSGVEQTY